MNMTITLQLDCPEPDAQAAAEACADALRNQGHTVIDRSWMHVSGHDQRPTLGLAVIAKNEEENLPHLLRSVEGAFDQVALLDTGSTDRTVGAFTDWAEAQALSLGYRVGHFAWCDDFAAARNAADALLDTDWQAWADCDDEIVGAIFLRQVITTADRRGGADGFAFAYDYNFLEGRCVSRLRKARLVRRGKCPWAGRVDELQETLGVPIGLIDPGQMRWVHRGSCDLGRHGKSYQRNIAILRRWVKDEPDSPRPLASLAVEEQTRGDLGRCIAALNRYLALPAVRDELLDQERVTARRAVVELQERRNEHPSLLFELVRAALGRELGFWDQHERRELDKAA